MAAAMMDVPDEKIAYFPGHSAKDFGSSMTAVAEAAADDGYPFLWQFAVGMESAWIRQTAGNVAVFWNWLRILKYIIAEGVTAVVLWDDRALNVEFQTLEQCVRQLHAHGKFALWQLRIRANHETLKALKRPAKEYEDVHEKAYLFKISKRVGFHDIATYLQKGLLGYDESMVITPRGAEWLYREMLTMPKHDVHRDFEFVEGRDDLLSAVELNREQRSRLTNDNWLCWDAQLQENVQKAVAAGMGIYTSRYIGYDFAHEYLPMGSLVDWATDTEDPFVLESQPPMAKIRFIEV